MQNSAMNAQDVTPISVAETLPMTSLAIYASLPVPALESDAYLKELDEASRPRLIEANKFMAPVAWLLVLVSILLEVCSGQ